MRASRFDDVIELIRFGVQRSDQVIQHAEQLIQAPQATQPDGGRDGVVGRLGHIDVVVRVHAIFP